METAADAEVAASRLGYPVLVKAAAGGGRQRIRMADDAGVARQGGARRRRPTPNAHFGDPRVYLEAWVPRARQVEVQFIADAGGHLWMPGIRDCTVQRGHRKMLEESSSPGLTADQEAAMREATARIVAAAGLVNAGTVEFFCDPEDSAVPPRLVKVNARLQAAHAVTEFTSGIDLVKLQLHVAEGGLLEGSVPEPTGHAVEVRSACRERDRRVRSRTAGHRLPAAAVRDRASGWTSASPKETRFRRRPTR